MPMANKKKIATSVAAVAVAAAMLLGGTFAWQSISQTALNEASDIVNPGGRLHDDFDGENKDVYVENFADEPIFARVRLGEYMEIVVNKGMGEPIEKTVAVIGDKTEEDGVEKYNYITFKDYENDGTFASAAMDTEGNPYWTWTTGGETVYMPTFNLNKDSLEADVNGTYEGPDGVRGENPANNDIDDKYEDYHGYTDGETEEGLEIYDADSNDVEDENVTKVEATHTATATDVAKLISMADWLAMNGIEAAAATAADDPYGVAPAFAENAVATLHYDKNAEDAVGEIADVQEPYDSELTLSDGSGFTREGYTLVSWNTEDDGSGTNYGLGQTGWMLPAGETTLYAVWQKNDSGTGGGTDDEDTQDDEPAYWVYDTDGWVYYSKPIEPHTATGLLLSGIELNEVMDDSWYYAIQVTGQFITADDLGSMEDGTGFYDTAKGSIPTDNALKLLEHIGVEVPEDGTAGDEGGEVEEYLTPDLTLPDLTFNDGETPSATVVRGKIYFPGKLRDADDQPIGINELEITSVNDDHTSYIGVNRIGAPVIAIAADEPNESLTLALKTLDLDTGSYIIRYATLNVINDVSGGGTTYKNTVVYGGTVPNEANMLSAGTTTVALYDENGKAFDFSEGSGNYLALSIDGEAWYVNFFDPNGFNATSLLGNTSSAIATKLGVAKIDEALDGMSVVDSSKIVWQDTQYLFIYYDIIHEYVQSYEYDGTTYFVMKDLVAENNTLCVIDPSKFQSGGQAYGCVIYNTATTDVNSIDWENLTSCDKCTSEKPTT